MDILVEKFYPYGNLGQLLNFLTQNVEQLIQSKLFFELWLQVFRMPLWCSHPRVPGYRSRDPGINSQCYQIFWEVVRLEQGPLKPHEYNWGATWIEINGCEDSLHWPHDTLYPQKLTLTSPTSGSRSVSIVRLRTKATEFSLDYRHLLPNSDCLCACIGDITGHEAGHYHKHT
jgi:hypothetical protein